ncbi:MAG: hypothetical protein VKP72_11420 [bacterium]|jgi:hypothetical protein|nr:hypothetical protein [bacterium]
MNTDLALQLESLFDRMIVHQREKVIEIARQLVPHLTPDDVLNPHDFPQLDADAQYNYEDGILAGFISAQMAIRAEFASRDLP